MAIDVSPPIFSRSAECNTTLRNLATKNPVPCGTDGIMGITQDAVHGLIVHTHIAEKMEETLSLAVISISKRFHTYAAANL